MGFCRESNSCFAVNRVPCKLLVSLKNFNKREESVISLDKVPFLSKKSGDVGESSSGIDF